MEPVMSPKIGIMINDTDGWPYLPREIQASFDGVNIVNITAWTELRPCKVNGYDSREYRCPALEQLVLVMKIGTVTLSSGESASLAIAWVPTTTINGDSIAYDIFINGPTLAPYLVKQWEIIVDSNGIYTIPSLDTDSSEAGLLAKNVWPSTWKSYQVGDSELSGPTGPVFIGDAIA